MQSGGGFEKDTGKRCQRSCDRGRWSSEALLCASPELQVSTNGCGFSWTRVWARFKPGLDAVTSSSCLCLLCRNKATWQFVFIFHPLYFLHNPSSSHNSNWKKEKYWSDSIMWFLNSYLLVATAATGEIPHLPVSLRFRYSCKSSCFPSPYTRWLQKTDIQIKQTKPELFIQSLFCD